MSIYEWEDSYDIIDDIRYNPSDISEQEELDDGGEYYN